MKMNLVRFCATIAATLAVTSSAVAQDAGGSKFKQGHWRLELSSAFGVESGSTDRKGDVYGIFAAEYEFPVQRRTTLSLRLLPAFVLAQDGEDRDRFNFREFFDDDDRDEGDTVYGGGFGLALRVYQKRDERRGLFGEIEANALFHSNRIVNNSSNVNFLTGAGLGYKFKKGFHIVVRFEHISNAGLGDRNAGLNAVNLGFGYSF